MFWENKLLTYVKISPKEGCALEQWREQLKKYPTRYWSRIEIEEIVKENKIDRNRFYEYSKNKYYQVIKRFYYSFVDYKNHSHIRLDYLWLHFRKDLKLLHREYISDDYIISLNRSIELLQYNWERKVFLILSDGWVYEGFIDEIISVLAETDGIIEDFYIVTPEYNKLLVYCNDGDCISIYEK